MITYIERAALHEEKYNNCITNSLQSKVYAYSWYLDIVADNWSVLVLDDYAAVMPICWRKKNFIKYVYPPFWLLELGVFSIDNTVNVEQFYKLLFTKFRFVESKLNTANPIKIEASYLVEKQVQVLPLNSNYDTIFSGFRKDRKKDLKKATKVGLSAKWNDDPKKIIQLFRDNVGKRTPFITDRDYDNLSKLITICIEKEVGEVLSIYNEQHQLVASGFFLKHKNTITILVSSTDFNFRKNGENTFLINTAIQKYHNDFELFNFGGSSMKSIAEYFLSFGAKTLNYQEIKYNQLPAFVKLFKR
ncbi:hypothetical protein [Polaribacter sp. MED152]|uniref:hypothetical protein n=1 Tax=Polaribacter sp. MED152 TaxID=313598 RepID=UPI0000689AE5|nr:hypothetical protein [Polaribacter sp. MED152]EAQ40834.1 hypothetical protein MED152_12389 [Polaribacter sp. MED152]